MASPRRALASLLAAVAVSAMAVAPALAQSTIRDTEIEEFIRQQADPVFAAAGLNPADVDVLLVNDKSLNAFATQGQLIGLNTGLILETETPNQLLGVIAHEAGHVAGGHAIRGDMGRAGMQPFLLTMGLGVLAALAGAPDAGAALMASSSYFGTLSALTYSRSQEGAADQAAATALDKAGLSGRGLVEFFENFRYQEVFSEARRFPFFRGHPLSSDRIEGLRRRVQELPNYDQVDSPEALAMHEIMKAKIDAFLSPPAQSFIKYKANDPSFPARYARAIAYYQNTQPDEAIAAIDALLQEQPENPYLWELKGQVLFESARAAEAEAAHRRAVQLKPEAPLLRVNLAQAIIAQDDHKRFQEAIGELKQSLVYEDDNALAWRLMAQAYDTLGEPGEARLASAEFHYAIGDMETAQTFALRARDMLERGSREWTRAVDIVMASGATAADLEELDENNAGAPAALR